MNLADLPAIDQHAHNVLRPEALARHPFVAAFTEGHDPAIFPHTRQSLFFRRSLRDLAELLGCDVTEEAITARRAELGLEDLTDLCFRRAGLQMVLLDDGFLPAEIQPLEWHRRYVAVQRLLRLEHLAEELLPRAADFDDFLDRYRAALDPPPTEVVAFKSIAAYRSGLDIQPISREAARDRFLHVRSQLDGGRVRLDDKSLIDFLLAQALEVAARHELPVQLHTGFGDPDLDLRQSNPLHLRELLENARFRRVPFVLLHASYPFVREAGYLAAVYPQVYLDCGLAVPFLSVAGMREVCRMLLELAPPSKVLYSSDAHLIPDLFYLAAKWGREVLGQVLEAAVQDGDLSAPEADKISLGILRDNARSLYKLKT
jgi:predicted TIM-barrel fold metal-dependent hydrolase